MPVHNAQASVGDSIASVRNQSFADWELLVVDDASTDGSASILRAIAKTDPRIKVLTLEANEGAAAARNHGLAHATGRYIAFLDADDLWHPEKLHRQIAFMRKYSAPISFTAYARMAPNGKQTEEVRARATLSYTRLLKRNVMGCLTVIYDTKTLGKTAMPLLTRQHDYALWLKLVKAAGAAHGLDELLAIYRVGRGTLSANKAAAASDIWRIYRTCERLGRIKSAWYFAHYAFYGLRYRLFQRPRDDAPVLDPTFGAATRDS
jgi:glycosyltransferase involved in cell wall biosynthesis